MSTRSRANLARVLGAIVVLAASAGACAGTTSVRLPEVGIVHIAADLAHVRASIGETANPSAGRAVTVDKRLAGELRHAVQVVAVAGRGFSDGDRRYFVLGVALPSVEKQGGGYCGAGTEDFLLLVELMHGQRRLEQRDSIPIQSCLQTMVLQSDQGNELPVVLRGIDDPRRAELTWLQHPRYGQATKTVTVDRGKFVVSP